MKAVKKEDIKKKSIETVIENKIKDVEKEIEEEILFNVPNSITLLRLLLTFVFIYMLFENFNIIALVTVYGVAALTDWFDGYFARLLNQKTKFGARMDQIVDRIFTVMIILSIIVYTLINKHNPAESIFDISPNNIFLLLFLTSSREILGAPGVIVLLIRKKNPYNVRYIGKVTTFIQSVTLGSIIIGLNLSIYLAMATCILGIISGFDYLKYSLS